MDDRLESPMFPPGRSLESDLRAEVAACVDSPVVMAILASLDGHVVVLNVHRQILAANASLLEALRREGVADPVGMRWGEASHCVHAEDGADGCGSGPACHYCGAALTLLAARDGHAPAEGECRMAIRHEGRWEAREFHVRATPVRLPFGEVLVPVFQDVTDSHRREVLEAAFLHDLGGPLAALACWADLLQEGGAEPQAAAARISGLAGVLSSLVEHQRLLLRAERGDLRPEASCIEPQAFLDQLAATLAEHPVARGKRVGVSVDAGDRVPVFTDPVLLHRILTNMGLNAIEAAGPGETVAMGLGRPDGVARFWVRNAACIPGPVARQIFQRSFSTKGGRGRGLGTYAMKLFGENVLGGRVGFDTGEAGTEFWISLPGPAGAGPGAR